MRILTTKGLLGLATLLLSAAVGATNLVMVGTPTYSISGTTLSFGSTVRNDDSVTSGTVQLQIWALASPFTGGTLSGYKLGDDSGILGTLAPGRVGTSSWFASFFTSPPSGTYVIAAVWTEFDGGPSNGGFSPRAYYNFAARTFGTVALPPITPETGIWWNPNESGTGYALDIQNGVLVILIFSYQPNGTSEWYYVSGPLTNGGRSFSAPLDKFRGGQCISCTYPGRPTSAGNDGVITITFSSPTSASLSLPGGRVTAIQPMKF